MRHLIVLDTEILPVNYANPVPGVFMEGETAHCVYRDDSNNQAILMEFEISGGELVYQESGDLQNDFPLYTWSNGGHILLLSWHSRVF